MFNERVNFLKFWISHVQLECSVNKQKGDLCREKMLIKTEKIHFTSKVFGFSWSWKVYKWQTHNVKTHTLIANCQEEAGDFFIYDFHITPISLSLNSIYQYIVLSLAVHSLEANSLYETFGVLV